MTNTTRMPWMKEDYTATKRAFKKRLGIFDKDVAIEEQEKEARIEEEAERILTERDERHERELEEQWEDGYEEREMERRLENQEQDRIEGDYEQRLLEEASERQGTITDAILTATQRIIEIEKAKNKNTITWEDAVTIIQTLVNERDNKITKQAWERILQG